ncbi:MAG: response regulator, partial [Myxococcota bacterium]|nr:response regulator [Myxococcota bacterium]
PGADAVALPSPDLARLAGVRALVVDDEEDARMLVATVLRRSGAEVRLAGSAAEALEMLHDADLDVLVSDIGMPDLDGITLIHRIRALPPPTCRIPAVAVTAYARSEDRDRAVAAGYDGFLSKPLDVDALAAIVARAVGRVE